MGAIDGSGRPGTASSRVEDRPMGSFILDYENPFKKNFGYGPDKAVEADHM